MSRVETINNPCDSTQNSPASWCKKSDSKDAEVPSADFLLEAEKRGTPPESEKAAAFWRVGGAGRVVQPFCKKEKSESNAKSGESNIDSLVQNCDSSNLDSRDLDCFVVASPLPRNDENIMDSSLRASHFAQNDGLGVDCFGDKSPRNDKINSKYKRTKGAK